MKFEILGTPKPKQSARFRSVKMGDKSFIKSYQKKEIINTERSIAFEIKSKLPANFIPFDCPIEMKIEYIFPIPSSFSKKKKGEIEYGNLVYKDTKPDLDNTTKMLLDSLEGVLFINDSRISKIEAIKYYGTTPKIIIEINEL